MAKGANNRKRTRKAKAEAGEGRLSKHNTGWNLDWYKPVGSQIDIIDAMDNKDLVIVNAPSGCGKSSTVLFKALLDYKERIYRNIVLIKNPTEAGTDMLGYLSGDKTSKLEAHMQAMKTLFYQFMDVAKLENDISNRNIILDIPNYLLGATINDSLIILEEAQTMTPDTIKLCAERAGIGSKVVVVGDSKQTYAARKREDGFKDLIERVTYLDYDVRLSKFPNVGYIEMESSNNMRSELSRFITELYDKED